MSETPSSEGKLSDVSSDDDTYETEPSTDVPKTSTPVLKIKSTANGDLSVITKFKGEVSIKPINLKFIIANMWWEKAPELETFFNVLELTIKRALNEVYPHEKLILNYRYCANDKLEDASEIIVQMDSMTADGTDVEIEGDNIALLGNDNRGFFKKLTSFRRKMVEEVHKEI